MDPKIDTLLVKSNFEATSYRIDFCPKNQTMTPKFTYDDIVVVGNTAPKEFRPGEKAWVVGVFSDRSKDKFSWLPPGVVYLVEFEDGEAIDVNEDFLRRYEGHTD